MAMVMVDLNETVELFYDYEYFFFSWMEKHYWNQCEDGCCSFIKFRFFLEGNKNAMIECVIEIEFGFRRKKNLEYIDQ